MREEFDDAYAAEFGRALFASSDDSRFHKASCWWAWQASRQVLVVELPMARSDVDYGYESSEIIDLLESAGIKCK